MENIQVQTMCSLIEKYLKDYLKTLYSYSIKIEEGTAILVKGQKTKENTGEFILFRLIVNVEHKELLISHIFIPSQDRRKGIGLGLIEFVFKVSKMVNYVLVLVDMTNSFRVKMMKRGAIETQRYDCLQVVESTNFHKI